MTLLILFITTEEIEVKVTSKLAMENYFAGRGSGSRSPSTPKRLREGNDFDVNQQASQFLTIESLSKRSRRDHSGTSQDSFYSNMDIDDLHDNSITPPMSKEVASKSDIGEKSFDYDTCFGTVSIALLIIRL